MNIFQKIVAAFKVNSFITAQIKEATKMESATPGYKTTEFWLNLLAQAGTVWASVQGFIPPKYAAIIGVVGTAVYTIARTVAKAIADIKANQVVVAPVGSVVVSSPAAINATVIKP